MKKECEKTDKWFGSELIWKELKELRESTLSLESKLADKNKNMDELMNNTKATIDNLRNKNVKFEEEINFLTQYINNKDKIIEKLKLENRKIANEQNSMNISNCLKKESIEQELQTQKQIQGLREDCQ